MSETGAHNSFRAPYKPIWLGETRGEKYEGWLGKQTAGLSVPRRTLPGVPRIRRSTMFVFDTQPFRAGLPSGGPALRASRDAWPIFIFFGALEAHQHSLRKTFPGGVC